MNDQEMVEELVQRDRIISEPIQPSRAQDLPRWKRCLHMIDIFAFLPVPRTDQVSTTRSLVGSCILFSVFLVYLIIGFVEFIIHNVPRVTQFTEVIDTANYTSPDMAIAFFWGDPFSETINNQSSLSLAMSEVIKYQNVSEDVPSVKVSCDSFIFYKQIPLIACNPEWIPPMGFSMLCPNQSTVMSGLLYATDIFIYPRFQVSLCDLEVEGNSCVDEDELYDITSGGRIILYLKNDSPNENLITGKRTNQINYTTFQFFIDPGLYPRQQQFLILPRAEIVIQKQTIIQTPDYFTHYWNREKSYFQVTGQNFYLSNTSFYDQGTNAFQIWVRLDEQQIIIQVNYQTIFDMISKWGAFWGVLFACFAVYFLRFNVKKFYKKNPNWEKFDEKFVQLPEEEKKINSSD